MEWALGRTLWAPGTERALGRTLWAPGTERALGRTLWAHGLERTLWANGTERDLERTLWAHGMERTLWANGTERDLERTLWAPGLERAPQLEERDEARAQVQRNGFLIIKENKKSNKNHPKGENRQAGRQRTVAQSNITHTGRKTTDQHRTADARRLNRETNEGDTGGATETMIS